MGLLADALAMLGVVAAVGLGVGYAHLAERMVSGR
jgi:hypothetical protein